MLLIIQGSCKGRGFSTYEKLSKASNSVGGVLYALEGQLACAQQNDSDAWSLLTLVEISQNVTTPFMTTHNL